MLLAGLGAAPDFSTVTLVWEQDDRGRGACGNDGRDDDGPSHYRGLIEPDMS
jgi:hypothetical protein